VVAPSLGPTRTEEDWVTPLPRTGASDDEVIRWPLVLDHLHMHQSEDFLPFVNPDLSHFLPHLHYRSPTNPAGIIARTMTQHGHQDTQ
jgi:hypothetical protein